MEQELLQRNGIQRVRTQFATISDAVILLTVLMQGRHLAVLPKTPLQLVRERYPLVELPLPAGSNGRNLYFWYRETLQDSEAIHTFAAIARGYCGRVFNGGACRVSSLAAIMIHMPFP
ncbi:MAG: hypothetical protein R3E89_08875 [Thiolinea sp.]